MSIFAEVGKSFQQFDGDRPDGWVEMQTPRPGDNFIALESGFWAPALAPVPFSVSRYQGREAMRLTPFQKEGFPDWTLFEAFEELLNDPATPAYYRRAWDELQVFERGSAMLNAAADVLGMTQARRDDLFRLGATLKA